MKDDDEFTAVVERKLLTDFASSLTSGKLGSTRGPGADPSRRDMLAECQVRHRSVPIIFAETRALIPEWAYRFFGATRW